MTEDEKFAKDALRRRLVLGDLVARVQNATLWVYRIIEHPQPAPSFSIGEFESSLPRSPFTICEVYAALPEGREPSVANSNPLRCLVDLPRTVKVSNEPRS